MGSGWRRLTVYLLKNWVPKLFYSGCFRFIGHTPNHISTARTNSKETVRRRQWHLSNMSQTIPQQCVMGVGPDLVTPSVGYDQSKSYERAFSRIQWRFALRSRLHPVQFKRHFDESRFYSVKSIRSSHKAKKPYGRSLVQFGWSRHKSKFSAPRVHWSSLRSQSQWVNCVVCESLRFLRFYVQVCCPYFDSYCWQVLLIFLMPSHVSQEPWSTFAIFCSLFYWTDPRSICTIASSSFLSSCCKRSDYSSECTIIVSKNIGGFVELCWTAWTILYRSCYCWFVNSHHGSDFWCWTTGWNATQHVEFSANDDDDESNTVGLTMFMGVRVSTMSGVTTGYYWSGTLRSYCRDYVYSRTLKCRALNHWSGTQSMWSSDYEETTDSWNAVGALWFTATIPDRNWLGSGFLRWCWTGWSKICMIRTTDSKMP